MAAAGICQVDTDHVPLGTKEAFSCLLFWQTEKANFSSKHHFQKANGTVVGGGRQQQQMIDHNMVKVPCLS